MSGPKSSRYSLTPEQIKRILEEQERIRKALEEKAKQDRECKEAKQQLSNLKVQINKRKKLVLARNDLVAALAEENVSELFLRLQEKINGALSLCDTSESDTHSQLMQKKAESLRVFEDICHQQNTFELCLQESALKQKISDGQSIVDAMSVSFAELGKVECVVNPQFEEATRRLEELAEIDVGDQLNSEVATAQRKLKELQDDTGLSNFLAITVIPLQKKCKERIEFERSQGTQFRILLDKYRSLCQQLQESEQEFPYSKCGFIRLEETIEAQEKRLLYSAEQEYIHQSIDAVMAEMGYHVIGSRHVTKRSGKSFTSKLLTYEDGTAVNITESSNGQITMEIGGIDNKDRLPDANERVALQKSMESFCSDFKEIEKRLADRGVILDSRLSMAPPDEAYAQIINYGDYELAEGVDVTALKSARTVSTTQKVMRT